MRQILIRMLLILAAAAASAASAAAQSGANVLLVVNDRSDASQRIGEYYARKRGIPASQVVHVTVPATDELSRAQYLATIESPIASALSRGNLQDQILYIVLTKGIPLRIAGTSGRSGTTASVDSELTLLYRKTTGADVPIDGPVPNPYFGGGTATVSDPPFSHAEQDIYLVTRLDGFTTEDALGLVDRSLAATQSAAAVVLNGRPGESSPTAHWLAAAADRLHGMHRDAQVLVSTPAGPAADAKLLGYYSYGSTDPALRVRAPAVQFAPGALAVMLLSTDARTMTAPPADWTPGPLGGLYAGSDQSLTGDLVRAGATGMAGQVSEPYLDGAVRPDVLFPAYAEGLNLAEAFYRAIPFLSWQTVVLGDPLCAPFRTPSVQASDLNPPTDPTTELPAQFSVRRLRTIAPGGSPALRQRLAQAEARRAKGDVSGAIAALEQATALTSVPEAAFRDLGMLYEQIGAFEKSRAAYQRALEDNPRDYVALNNVAYGIAVRDHDPAGALPFAERAFAFSNGNGLVSDTLGWIKHLLGDNDAALPLLEHAAAVNRASVDVQIHLAAVYVSESRLQDAARTLQVARTLDPSVEQRDDYNALRTRIKG